MLPAMSLVMQELPTVTAPVNRVTVEMGSVRCESRPDLRERTLPGWADHTPHRWMYIIWEQVGMYIIIISSSSSSNMDAG